jgi:hypothetical protein
MSSIRYKDFIDGMAITISKIAGTTVQILSTVWFSNMNLLYFLFFMDVIIVYNVMDTTTAKIIILWSLNIIMCSISVDFLSWKVICVQ